MSELLEFLNRCLDAEERIARAAQNDAQSPWTSRAGMVVASATVNNGAMHPDEDLWDNEGAGSLETSAQIAEHIALHDPAAVLADIAGKREILAEHPLVETSFGGPDCYRCHDRSIREPKPWPCDTVRALASIYRHRPGWREEWAPTPPMIPRRPS